jgi:hypothetical protein
LFSRSQLDDWVLCRIYNKKSASERPAGREHSPPEQKPAALLPPPGATGAAGYAPPPFPELAAYHEVRPSDSMPRAPGTTDSSCSGQQQQHALATAEVQSRPKTIIAEWERTFASADPAGSMLGPGARVSAGDPLLQDILTYWGNKPF